MKCSEYGICLGLCLLRIFAHINELDACYQFAVSGTQRPSYPSSRPTKDWDKLEAQVKMEVCL